MWRLAHPAITCAALVAAAWQLHAQQPQPPSPATGTGLVVGRVIDGTATTPLAGVTVVASMARPGSGSGPLPGVPRVMTGADGVFVFRNLPKGDFTLSASAPGYLPGTAGMNRLDGRPLPVTLAEGERVNDVVVRLWKASSVSGRAEDEFGEPLEGMAIQLLRVERFGARRRFATHQATTTDDRGMYRLAGVAPGEYAVCAMFSRHVVPVAAGIAQASGNADMRRLMEGSGAMSASGSGYRVGDFILVSASAQRNVDPAPDESGKLSVFADACHPGASSIGGADPIVLGYAEQRSVNLMLRVVPSATITGTVTGPSGRVGAGLGIRLFSASPDDASIESGLEAANTVTAPDGTFGFIGVPPGSYIVRTTWVPQASYEYPPELLARIEAEGIDLPGQAPPKPEAARTRALFASQPVSVGGTDAAAVALLLREGAQMTGRLAFEGSARQPEGPVLARIGVTLHPADGQLLDRFAQPRGAVSADGTFIVGGLFPGAFLVRASGPAGWRLKSALVNGIDAAADPIDSDGRDLTGVILTFTDRPSELAGIVRDASGTPDPAASVIVFPADQSRWLPFGVTSTRTAVVRTSKAGAFSVPNLPAGEYFVIAVDDRTNTRWQDSATLTVLARTAIRVTMRNDERRMQDLVTSRGR